MPHVITRTVCAAGVDAVWAKLKDIESYPTYMTVVRSVEIERELSDGRRISSWSVLLKGSVLEWREEEVVDEASRTLSFEQLDGDMDVFSGQWRVTAESGGTVITMEATFDIGIPLLAEMLNPVAEKALRDSCVQIASAVGAQAHA
ncbi:MULTISPECIES: type II toxin-antitoxin system RatA family toxin [unclassified Micromonospora]|uniref:type II toxin-antitoxin system RatA family toxin n=1 Tax=unclassified Micromonospora TaxID=2617518 RepID=UPI0022C9EFDA|nr:SRPBCC family protein [Micromonospora sp. AKA38]GHJ16149.1 cyclase [Micromonospora sp. AKA38]